MMVQITNNTMPQPAAACLPCIVGAAPRRVAHGPDGGVWANGAVVAGACARAEPHLRQARWPCGFSHPHRGHAIWASAAPNAAPHTAQ